MTTMQDYPEPHFYRQLRRSLFYTIFISLRYYCCTHHNPQLKYLNIATVPAHSVLDVHACTRVSPRVHYSVFGLDLVRTNTP